MILTKTAALCILDAINKKEKWIGIGINLDPERVFSGIGKYSGVWPIKCYISDNVRIPSTFKGQYIRSETPEKDLIRDLQSGVIEVAVRGTLPANDTLHLLRQSCGVRELMRIVLMESYDGHQFFLAPVGVDEGYSISQKIEFIKKGRELCRKYGISDKVSVLSGGRLGDIGRHCIVDRSLADGELIAKVTGAEHTGILIEEAILKSGLIIAPDGISGNLIFRTLLFLGKGHSHGAPVVNIDKKFVDTSRVNPDYHYALNLAGSLIID